MKNKFMQSAVIPLILVLITLAAGCQPSEPPATPAPTPALTPTPTPTPAPRTAPVPRTRPSTPAPTPEPSPEPTPPPDTTPPSDTEPPPAVTGLIANNAYDGRINLWWDKSTAQDFARYNVYVSQEEIADAGGMTPVRQITDIATCKYQATGLEDGAEYHVAVTAVDESGNEDVNVESVSATPVPMPEGTQDPLLTVEVYQPDKVWAGTTFLGTIYHENRNRVLEVNMHGEVVWEYEVPQQGRTEAELLPNDHILYTVNPDGIYEIDRSGQLIWSYSTRQVDHDADRLPDGNTIFVFGFDDQKEDAQVTEVNSDGEVVWEWFARDHFDLPPYNDIYDDGWVHTNAVIRLPNGNTLISLRNFDMVVEVDPEGNVVRKIGEGILVGIHDPEFLSNGNLLGPLPAVTNPAHVVELNPDNDEIVWQYRWPGNIWPQNARDANRLPNGNTIIAGTTAVVEVTPQGEIVWQLRLQGITAEQAAREGIAFYKADRISAQE